MANQTNNKRGKGKAPQPKFNAVWIYVPLLVMIGYMYFFGANGGII